MRREIKKFIKICKKNQTELKSYLKQRLEQFGYSPVSKDGYLLAVGGDVMVTAHMDTVHKETVKTTKVQTWKEFNSNGLTLSEFGKTYIGKTEKSKKDDNLTVISSPQGIGGDDRCGVYMILTLLEKGYAPTVLFCEDEEIGGVGSNKFVKTKDADILKDMKYILELDRANENDAVYYDCGNEDFEEYINSFGFNTDWGSFSDIGHLSPAGDNASVNLSCGYYKQHTTSEYVIFEEMEKTIDKVCNLLDDSDNVERFDYQEIKYYNSFKWDSYLDKYSTSRHEDPYKKYLDSYVIYYVNGDDMYIDTVDAISQSDALYTWMLENPNKKICFNDIIEIMTEWEFIEVYGIDPEDYFAVYGKPTANEYILANLEYDVV